MGVRIALVAALAAFTSLPAQADDYPQDIAARKGTLKLEPAAPWNIDFKPDRCILSRLFDSKYGQHLIFFEQAAPGSSFGMTMAGKRIRKFPRGTWTYLGIRSDVPMQHLSGEQYGEVPSIGDAIIISNVYLGLADPEAKPDQQGAAGIDLEAAGKVDRVILKLGTTGLSFETGNMAPPMQALNVCTKGLLTEWGLDAELHSDYTRPKWLNSEPIVKAIQENYPRGNETGIFRLRVIVEKNGSVSDCSSVKSTETRRLETPACAEMLKAKFEPARDAQGEPMRSYYATSISYVG